MWTAVRVFDNFRRKLSPDGYIIGFSTGRGPYGSHHNSGPRSARHVPQSMLPNKVLIFSYLIGKSGSTLYAALLEMELSLFLFIDNFSAHFFYCFFSLPFHRWNFFIVVGCINYIQSWVLMGSVGSAAHRLLIFWLVAFLSQLVLMAVEMDGSRRDHVLKMLARVQSLYINLRTWSGRPHVQTPGTCGDEPFLEFLWIGFSPLVSGPTNSFVLSLIRWPDGLQALWLWSVHSSAIRYFILFYCYFLWWIPAICWRA